VAAVHRRGPQFSLAVGPDQALIGLLEDEEGKQVVHYFAGDVPADDADADAVIANALSLAGAWSDLDWERTAEALDRIRHAAPPTPPIGP
jgi:hypothetical protein